MQDDDITNEDSESDEEDDNFDSVCAICDNGGNLTWYYLLLHVFVFLRKNYCLLIQVIAGFIFPSVSGE